MISAEVQLLESNVQANMSVILELELKYLQNELNSIILSVSLLGSTVFFTLVMGEPTSTHLDLSLTDQTITVGIASFTLVLAMMTLCSAIFLNLWGANECLRTKNISELTKAVDSMRRERIVTMRIFILTVFFFLQTAIWMTKLYWVPVAFYVGCSILVVGHMALYYLYRRTRGLFVCAPPIFGLANEWNTFQQEWLGKGDERYQQSTCVSSQYSHQRGFSTYDQSHASMASQLSSSAGSAYSPSVRRPARDVLHSA
jgi:hypothetical protein